MNSVVTLTTVLGAVGLGVAGGALADAARRFRKLAADSRKRPRPSHVTVEIKYEDGQQAHLEVDPRNPQDAEEALRELKHA